MKTKLILFTLLLGNILCKGQTPLPYYTGFDNAAQLAGWVDFRKGYISSSDWSIVSAFSYSAPKCLSHDYPVGSAGTDTTVDWYVSPMFNFPAGGKIDSLKINVYSITGSSTPVDELSLYLLAGSNNPSAATSIIHLADLKNMVSSSNVWKDTSNFIIPPTAGNCYVAIKYRATNNWFVISIDDIHISGNATGINEMSAGNNNLFLYPNPCTDQLQIMLPSTNAKLTGVTIIDPLGQCVLTQKPENNSGDLIMDVSALKKGIYFVQTIDENKQVVSKKMIVQ